MMLHSKLALQDPVLFREFESVRRELLADVRFQDRMERPLGFWTLPGDRRLPLALLDRKLGEVLSTSFADLSATPGIGQKKITSLVKLLERATQDEPPRIPLGLDERRPTAGEDAAREPLTMTVFDADLVSEALWVQWRKVVREQQLGDLKLGGLMPSLQELPTVIWHTSLSYYLNYSVAQIRRLKTHGEKRVRVVLEAFFIVQDAVTRGPEHQPHLTSDLRPKLAGDLDRWAVQATRADKMPSRQQLIDELIQPLLSQIRVDAGETVAELAAGRLGVLTPPQSVRMQSRKMGVTRARVYQLLDECGKVLEVRWPSGERQLAAIAERMLHVGADEKTARLFHAARELFFPARCDEFTR